MGHLAEEPRAGGHGSQDGVAQEAVTDDNGKQARGQQLGSIVTTGGQTIKTHDFFQALKSKNSCPLVSSHLVA